MDYMAKSNDELRELCSGRGLPTYGNKAALVARLVEADEAAGAVGRGGAVAPASAETGASDAVEGLDPDAWGAGTDPEAAPQEPDASEPAQPDGEVMADAPADATAPDDDDATDPPAGDSTPDEPSATDSQVAERPLALFRTAFPIEGTEFTDEQHWRFVAETAARAREAGHTPLGAGGHRVGSSVNEQGHPTAVYEIDLRR